MSNFRVVVTGAAGGIGSAVCNAFAAAGAGVVGLSLNGDTPTSEAYAVDLSDSTQVIEVAAHIASSGSVSCVVHLAAVQPMAGAGHTTVEQWQETLNVNVVALDLLVGGLLSAMSPGGAVIAVSSVHARATTQGICAYATSKAALEGWVRAAAIDLGPQVRTLGLTLGAVDGPKLREGFARWGSDAQTRLAILESSTPAGRIGTAQEVADTIVWLAGEQARFITGTNIVLDGGALALLGSE